MSETEPLNALANHAFLRGMSPAHLAALASCTHRVTVTAGQYLSREREPANAFHLVQSGRVAIELRLADDKPVCLQKIGPGAIVGWSWLVAPHRWQFDARVLDSVQALALNAERLREMCRHDHELGHQLLERLVAVIGGRLAATRRHLLDQ